MNNVNFGVASPDAAGTIASPSSLDVLDADWNVDLCEPTVVPSTAVRGHRRMIGVAACRLVRGTLLHRGRTTARTRGADFHYAWTVTRDNRLLTCRGEPVAPARATRARGVADSCEDARALVRMFEETLPMASLGIMHESAAVNDAEPFAGAVPRAEDEVIRRIRRALVSQDKTPGEAYSRTRHMWRFEYRLGAEA